MPVRHSTYIPFADSQRTVSVCATAAAATSRTATARNVVLRIVVCPPPLGNARSVPEKAGWSAGTDARTPQLLRAKGASHEPDPARQQHQHQQSIEQAGRLKVDVEVREDAG